MLRPINLFRFTHPNSLLRASRPQQRNLARLSIIGRLAADPEEVTTNNGKSLLRYAVGTTYVSNQAKKTSWFKVTCFDEGVIRQILLGITKGTLVHVEADARLRVVEDEDGRKRTQIDLRQRSLEVLSRPRTDGDQGEQNAATAAAGAEAGDEAV